MWLVSTTLASLLVVYVLTTFVSSRKRQRAPRAVPKDLFFVFMVPCLNEELVVGKCIERLLALPHDNFAVLVIDDGSEDATPDIVRSYDPRRVFLLQRRFPEARQGKGEALNAAYRHLADLECVKGRPASDVIVVIVDADGRLEADAVFEVAPIFADELVGAVQIGVRMYNADAGYLARMQDFEFVTFTEIFQRARNNFGISGLGGNGQFNRLAALQSLGRAPWSSCLTEDLDLGIRMVAAGWRTSYCSTTWVNQQAVTNLRRLVRQRARWFQGHLQCWRLIGHVLRSRISTRATFDLVHHLFSPALVLLMSMAVPLFLGAAAGAGAIDPHLLLRTVTYDHGLLVGVMYALSFGLAIPYGFSYWLQDPQTSWIRALFLGHLFTLYGYLWFPAGWMAVARLARKRQGWAKTARTVVLEAAT